MTFQLDTSGVVLGTFPTTADTQAERFIAWSDLNPFTQGYTAKVLEEAKAPFHMLAPETLARCMNDAPGAKGSTAQQGATFWRERQEGQFDAFPPVIPYLGEDGKVYLREAS